MNVGQGQMSGGSYAGDYVAKGQYAGSIEPQRQPEIPRYMQELEKNLARCAEAFCALDSKLSAGGVSSSEPPSPGADCEKEASPQTGMGSVLAGLSGQANALAMRLQSLMRRVEV